MAKITLNDVSVVYPMLGRGPKQPLMEGEPEGAGSFIRDTADRGRGVMALSNVTLSMETGDRVGLIGRNGSGKSTLLRTIAGIYEPDSGRITVEGAVAGLFNASLGIRAEATGYRNIELSGLIAGYPREAIREILPKIAEFTELGDYLNYPVRTYSNGMAMRLKFACATAFHPDILLLDEWLGAGDPDFQKKAQARMVEMVEQAGIMILASHNHNLIKETCDKVAWLERGELRAYGPAGDVIAFAEGRQSIADDYYYEEDCLELVSASSEATRES
ncbi:ABC transporter ATP-binding protein [Parvularcula oceani]|uniref:ABC transporter ATP-binding protein n=1 Tax=Parvularcula oceani TaxID=1247963 RepID=UPI0009DFA52B|nr:ABC transporter ATP-binding protein [Parvularcula oceani]